MDEEEQQQSDSKISVSSFFERVDSVDKVANSALSRANANLGIINNQKTLINSINVSIEALETKVRDIANFIIIEKKLEKDAEEDRRFEQQDEAQKGSMLERLAGLKSNNESEQTQTAGEEPKKGGGGGGILGNLLKLGIGAFALKFLWPAILPLVGGLLKGGLAKVTTLGIGGIGGLTKGLIVGSPLAGIGFLGIGEMIKGFGNSIKSGADKVAERAGNAIRGFTFKKDGKVAGADSLNVEGGSEGGSEGGGLTDFGDDYKAQEEYYQSEEYRKTINEDGIGTSYEDMKKTLEKKNLLTIEKSKYSFDSESGESSEKSDLIQLLVKEYDKVEEKMENEDVMTVSAELETIDEAINNLRFNKKENESGGYDYLQNFLKEQNVEFDPNQGISDKTKKIIELDDNLEPITENKNLDLSLSETFSDKFLSLDQQVDTLSEDFTGSINAEQGQMFSRPANSPNTTVTVFKQTSSNSPFTSLMSNKYLSLNKTLPPEVYRAIK